FTYSLPSLALFFHVSAPPLHLPSFPTRRSSDLFFFFTPDFGQFDQHFVGNVEWQRHVIFGLVGGIAKHHSLITGTLFLFVLTIRSEEHTSELQSRFDLVCRLLLEKKKNTQQ